MSSPEVLNPCSLVQRGDRMPRQHRKPTGTPINSQGSQIQGDINHPLLPTSGPSNGSLRRSILGGAMRATQKGLRR